MKDIQKGILIGFVTIVAYLTVVVITTPALAPLDAIRAAFYLNSPIIIGMGVGVGLQVFLSSYGQKLGCLLASRKKLFGGNSGSTAATSFFSFFSLVPLGCCGWWLYVLSFLPSIFGTGFATVLTNYSNPLAYLGLAVIFTFNGLTTLRIMQKKRQQKIL